MGKSKKRNLNKLIEKSSVNIKRSEVVNRIIFDLRNKSVDEETIKYINLFGIKTEELTEAGARYEELSSIKLFLI